MDDSGIDSDHKYQQLLFENKFILASDSSATSTATVNSPAKTSKTLCLGTSDKNHCSQFESKRSPSLIPIELLPIPASKTTVLEQIERKLLVDWESDDRGSEEEIEFFPTSRNRPQLTDTFSIEEFQISPDDEDDLNLLPPKLPKEGMKLSCFDRCKCDIL